MTSLEQRLSEASDSAGIEQPHLIDPKEATPETLIRWLRDPLFNPPNMEWRQAIATALDLASKREAELVAELGEARAVSEKRLKRVLALDMALLDGNAEVARLTAALSAANEACAKVAETFVSGKMPPDASGRSMSIILTTRQVVKSISAAIRSRSTGEA